MRTATSNLLIQSVIVLLICQVIKCDDKNRTAKATSSQVSDDTLERAIKDSRYFNRQFSCLTSEGPCDHVGRRLKAVVPLVVRGLGCPKCTQKEEEQMKKVVLYVQRNYPDKWQKLIKKYGSR